LTLPYLGFSADLGLGLGQSTVVDPSPDYNTPLGIQKPGLGMHLMAALGLPLGFEVGFAEGYRFAPSGILTSADSYGRLYDPVSLHIDTAARPFTNPEVRVTQALLDKRPLGFGEEVRLLVGVARSSVLAPGLPVRFRVPDVVRIDTGIWVPISFVERTWGFELPLSVWFAHGPLFFGPMTGLFFNNPRNGTAPGGEPSEVAIHAGVAAGYTFERRVDLKAQVLTIRLGDPEWSRYIGGGLAVGVVLP
jgi:hypothetical protein